MTQRHIGTLLDRKAINDINDNFTELYDEYIGAGLDAAEAKEKAIQAVADSLYAKQTAETTRDELTRIIREQTAGGDVVPEVVQARGTHSTVGDRLNSISQDLAQKPNKNDVRLKSESIGLNDADSELLAAIEGGEGTSFNLLSIPRPKSVIPESTTFIQQSTNLFNKDTLIPRKSINGSTGELIDNSGNDTSDWISVLPSTQYTGYRMGRKAFYTADKIFISSDTEDGTFTTPDNAYFMRMVVSRLYTDEAQLNMGDTLLPYEPYYSKLDESIEVDVSEQLRNIKFTEENAEFIMKTSNMFNPDAVLDGYNYDHTTQEIVADPQHGLSDFIEVNPSSTYTGVNFSKIVRFNSDKEYISNYSVNPDGNPRTFSTTSGTAYIRVIVPRNSYDTVQLNEGDTLLPFEPFGSKLSPSIFVEQKREIDLWKEDRFVIDGLTEGVYTSPELEAIGSYRPSSSEFISSYDDFTNPHPEYIQKTVWDTDGLGENIYRYDFKPEAVPHFNENIDKLTTKFPKIILISGIHGEEKAGAFNIYNALKQITENWRDNELLETLRWNVHFIVIPIVNNYGWNNGIRQNENGVDMARNFPEGWELNTSQPGDKTYGGTHPLSEKGAQAVARLLEENKDAIYFTSHHSFGANWDLDDRNFIWNASATKLQVQLGKRLVSQMNRKWQKEYEWMPQDRYIGSSDHNAPVGSEAVYAASLGIQASTFETSDALPHETSRYSSLAVTLGAETFLNWLLLNLKENVKFYNSL